MMYQRREIATSGGAAQTQTRSRAELASIAATITCTADTTTITSSTTSTCSHTTSARSSLHHSGCVTVTRLHCTVIDKRNATLRLSGDSETSL